MKKRIKNKYNNLRMKPWEKGKKSQRKAVEKK